MPGPMIAAVTEPGQSARPNVDRSPSRTARMGGCGSFRRFSQRIVSSVEASQLFSLLCLLSLPHRAEPEGSPVRDGVRAPGEGRRPAATPPTYRALNPQGVAAHPRARRAACSRSRSPSSSIWRRCGREPPLLPGDAEMRAKVRAFALAIACDVGPVNNLRVLRYLKRAMGAGAGGNRHIGIGIGRRAGSRPARRCCRRPSTASASASSRRWPISA